MEMAHRLARFSVGTSTLSNNRSNAIIIVAHGLECVSLMCVPTKVTTRMHFDGISCHKHENGGSRYAFVGPDGVCRMMNDAFDHRSANPQIPKKKKKNPTSCSVYRFLLGVAAYRSRTNQRHRDDVCRKRAYTN